MTTKEAVRFITRNTNITGHGTCSDNRRRKAVRTNHPAVTAGIIADFKTAKYNHRQAMINRLKAQILDWCDILA